MKVQHVKHKTQNIINVNHISSVHYYEFDNNFIFAGEKHKDWELVYVDKGSVKITAGEKDFILSAGDIIFHEPDEFHSVKSYNSSPNFAVISFKSNSELLKYFSKYKATLKNTLKTFLVAIINEAENTYEIPKNNIYVGTEKLKTDAKVGGEQLIKTYLEQFLIMLIRSIIDQKDSTIFPSKEQKESYAVSQTKTYIDNHITEKIRISDLCKQTGYGKTYLSNLFHSQSGCTIINYLNHKKIELAKDLIRNGDKNITEISYYLSFDNPQYFSRVFKRITNMTPSEFRHSLQQ